MTITRRSILTGLVGLIAAPAIVRVSSLMPISVQHQYVTLHINDVPLHVPYYPDEGAGPLARRIQGYLTRSGIPLCCSAQGGVVGIHSGQSDPILRPIAHGVRYSLREAA